MTWIHQVAVLTQLRFCNCQVQDREMSRNVSLLVVVAVFHFMVLSGEHASVHHCYCTRVRVRGIFTGGTR